MFPVHEDARFAKTPGGRFMERYGPMDRDAAYSQKKLCISATDISLLAHLLYGLSLRDDCFYVKYACFARDGMFLGRVFLRTDAAVGELCQALKGHARLLVSVQDDDFFETYRQPRVEVGEYGVWDEFVDDAPAIAEVHRKAFGQPDEAAMVEAVRASRVPAISLVAQTPLADRERDGWLTVGHVLLSPVSVDGWDGPPGLGLAPLAVLPDHQRRGLGIRLTEAALERARMLGYAYFVVLGHPAYYPRFGFVPASRFGLCYDPPLPDEVFMALELTAGALAGASGIVRYQPAFR